MIKHEGDNPDFDQSSIVYSSDTDKFLAGTTLNEVLAARFMRTTRMQAWIRIGGQESLDLQGYNRFLDRIFNVPAGNRMSDITGEDTISETPQLTLARRNNDPHDYSVYLKGEAEPGSEQHLNALNEAVKSALSQVLREEKLSFKPKFSTSDLGGFKLRYRASEPSIHPLDYIAGRIFLAQHGSCFIIPVV